MESFGCGVLNRSVQVARSSVPDTIRGIFSSFRLLSRVSIIPNMKNHQWELSSLHPQSWLYSSMRLCPGWRWISHCKYSAIMNANAVPIPTSGYAFTCEDFHRGTFLDMMSLIGLQNASFFTSPLDCIWYLLKEDDEPVGGCNVVIASWPMSFQVRYSEWRWYTGSSELQKTLARLWPSLWGLTLEKSQATYVRGAG